MSRRSATSQAASRCDRAHASLRALLALALVLQALAGGPAGQPRSVAAVEAAALGDLCAPGGDAPRRDGTRCEQCALCASPLPPVVAAEAAQLRLVSAQARAVLAVRLLAPAAFGPPLPARGPPVLS